MTGTIGRRVASVAAVTVVGLTLAACGSSGPSATNSKAASGAGSVWVLTDASLNPVQQTSIDAFNKGATAKFTLSNYGNDPYKQKLQTAIGSPNQPDIFYNWGGGNLAQYVDAGQVADLTATLNANPGFRAKFIPSVLDVGKIHGKVYGLPMQGVQPVMMFANADVLKKAGIDTMAITWDGLLADVGKLKAAGVTPIALAGSQSWTELMWLEYLVDRIGGPEKFQAIVAGKAGAWSDPAVVGALTKVQDLVSAGAFGSNYSAVGYDNQGTQALIAGDKAGYELMGSWEVSSLNGSFPAFAKSAALEWGKFPTVAGGTGDPASLVGNPSNYYSVTQKSPNKAAAMKYLVDTLTSDTYAQGLMGIGQVPAITGLEKKVKTGTFAGFNAFTYALVGTAPSFTQSWDQALTAATSEKLLTNLQKIFLKEMTPRQFVAAMGS